MRAYWRLLTLTCPRLQGDEGRRSHRTPIEAANERAYLVGRDDHPFGGAGQTGFLFVSQASRNA